MMALAIPQSVKAYDFSYTYQGQTLYYNIVDGNAQVTNQISYSPRYYNLTGSLSIPDSVTYNGNTYAVTSIDDGAFSGCSGLTSVTIPDGVTSIGDCAFRNCSGLTSVTIPDAVTSIGGGAFSGCSGLISVTIPDAVNSIDSCVFNGCSGLTSVTIPDAVTYIGNNAFAGCSGLTSVTIPDAVTYIGEYTFYNCSGLTSVTIPAGVTSIREYTFYGCSGLTSITIPAGVTSIGEGAFADCSSLTSVEFNADSCTSVGYYSYYNGSYYGAFNNCTNITNFTFGDNVKVIPKYLCYGLSGLTSVTIGNGVTSIGDRVFYGCSGLTTITIPGAVTSIGYSAFLGCSGLTSVAFNADSCSRTDSTTFKCSNITNFTFGDNVKVIPDYLCYGLSGLTSVTIPDAVTSIGNSAFFDCSGLTSVTIPDAVTSIGNSAFNGCTGLTSVTIGNAVTSIGREAFSSCSGLTSVTIPDAVTSIGDYAFYDCSGLTEITSLATVAPIVGYNAFVNVSSTIPVNIPCGSSMSYYSQWSYFSNFVEPAVFSVSVESEDGGKGTVYVPTEPTCADSTAVFNAVANWGYRFDHWNDGNTDNPRTIALTQDTAFTAMFAKNIYSVSAASADTVRGTVTGSDAVEYLGDITIMATANYGYHFAHWNDGNTSNPRTLQVTRDSSFMAIFDKNIYSIIAAADTDFHGTVTGTGSYEYLDEITISVSPNYGYHFTQWDDGDTNNPRIVSLTQDTAFTAMFAKNSYTLTILSDTALGEATGSTTAEYLDTVVITAVVTAPHYHFVMWSDGDTAADRAITIMCDSVITAIFAIDTHTVTLMANDDQYGIVNGTGHYPYGSDVMIEAIAAYGYHFVEWSNGSTDNPDTLVITGDSTITAIFAPDIDIELCMVSVQDNHNVVLWTKRQEVLQYNIYREGATTGNYELVASIPYDSASKWVDIESHPMSRSYRYRMTAIDTFGVESAPSIVHKTMHLTISPGMSNNRWNLSWTEYEGAEFISYMIYRGSHRNGLELIDQMPVGGNTTYTDEDAPGSTVYYQVVAIKSFPCNITKSETLIRSNIATNDEDVGIEYISNDGIHVYSLDGRIVVEGTTDKVSVFDIMGRMVSNESLPDGVYMVKIGNLPARKVVVVR